MAAVHMHVTWNKRTFNERSNIKAPSLSHKQQHDPHCMHAKHQVSQ